jgi:signal transduction histidine kinase
MTNPLTIVLVEDNPRDARLVQEMLRDMPTASWRIDTRLHDVLGRLEHESCDVLLLDLGLPDSQGLTTFHRVHAQVPTTPIIIFSGADDEELAAEAVMQGAQDYLVKGQIDATLLKRAIRYAIERQRLAERTIQLLEAARFAEERRLALEEASRLKSQFLASMSHELRTPLNAIIGFAQLMHRGKVGPVSAQHQEYLGDILTSARHLLQLVNDVLDLAKVEAGRMEFRPESVHLTTLIHEVCDVLCGLAADKRLRINSVVDSGVDTVVIDSARLKQVLLNYLSNAIKFTRDEGQIDVRVAPDGLESFRLDVEDSGIGIAAQDLEKLFSEFQQVGEAATLHQGTGMGLALTRRLVEAQGGRVEVRSTLGVGSTFSAILPRSARAIPGTESAQRGPDQPKSEP